MSRRCSSETCQINAERMVRLDLPIANVLHNPQKQWSRLSKGSVRVAYDTSLDVDWNEYTPENYLFTQCSIVSSVVVAENGYYIEPPCDELVNSNGNAWSTPVLLATFKSFIGKPNYLEHQQIPSLSKGIILDAVARPVMYKGESGKTVEVYYVDILVATNRKHTDIVEKVEAGELVTLSMGCEAFKVQCSQCGKVIGDNDKNCEHLDNNMLQYFTDENGQKRICAELCGTSYIDEKTGERVGDPESVKFIEASWVEKPAFQGAVVSHYIHDEDTLKAIEAKQASLQQLDSVVDDIFKVRVADANGMMVLRVAKDYWQELQYREMLDRIGD